MRPVTAGELTSARVDFVATLAERPRLLRYNRSRTAGANYRETWEAAAGADAEVAASRSDPTRSELQTMQDRYGEHARHVVTLEHGTTAAPRDRLDFGDQVLEVVGRLTRGPWALGARWAATEVGERG